MFDKITIRATLSDEECVNLAHLHRLHAWVNEAGTQVEYRSSEYAKLTGIEVKIIRNKVTIKTSLHKFYNSRVSGALRNDNLFTISEAKLAAEMLLHENDLAPERTRVVQFEIGLNLIVSRDPISFIERARYICNRDKAMFIDANFRVNRQKTTEKHRHIRKYFKIYDKGFEMQEKKRFVDSMKTRDHVLRCETVFRRHSEAASTFFTDRNVNRLAQRFLIDWDSLFFFRNIRADKGTRKSEIERARRCFDLGTEEYLEKSREELEKGIITPKQFRTIREFARDFEHNKHRFSQEVSAQETEYKRLLHKVFQQANK